MLTCDSRGDSRSQPHGCIVHAMSPTCAMHSNVETELILSFILTSSTMALPLLRLMLVIMPVLAVSLASATDLAPRPPVLNPLELALPLECRLGETCWVANYVDVDPATTAHDFRCHVRTYEGHDGTDFAIRDLSVMAAGVPVLASAPGVVRNARDGMADLALTDALSRERIAGRECGNGVVLDHEDGWQTQYCHLRRGTVRVKEGERVARGQPLGLVGLSGQTEFPHVHMTVRHRSQVIDPFTGQSSRTGCGRAGTSMWQTDQAVSYEPFALYHAGVASSPPDIDSVRAGKMEDSSPSATSASLVLWVDILGVEAGDRVRFHLTGPDGVVVLDHVTAIAKTQARHFAYAGAHRHADPWKPGTYRGEVTLVRDSQGQALHGSVQRTITIR
jgi:murein DD-endopeptidase MepM/ murein hydrolase activator NlpD